MVITFQPVLSAMESPPQRSQSRITAMRMVLVCLVEKLVIMEPAKVLLGCLCVASTNETVQDVTTLLDCIPLKQKGPESIIWAFRLPVGLDLRYGSLGCSLAVGRNILDLIYMQLSPVGTSPGA